MLRPVLRRAIEAPADQAAGERFEGTVHLMATLFPEFSAMLEGCDLTVGAETEDQLQFYVDHFRRIYGANCVRVTIDGCVYECPVSYELVRLLKSSLVSLK
jgi:hypothetical protein